MAILYFDGFDQYMSVPEPVAPATCSSVQGVNNQAAVATDPAIVTPNIYSMYSKLKGEDRMYRVPFSGSAGISTYGSNQYTYNIGSPTYSRSDSAYGFTLNALKPLSEHKKLVLGFKIKYAGYAYRPQTGYWLPLAVFSATPQFTTTSSMWAVCLGANGVIRLVATSTSSAYGYTFNGTWNSVFSGDAFVAGDTGLIGTSNFVAGISGVNLNTQTTPPIEQLAANTVEIEVTDAGKVTVWINNQYVGSNTFANLGYVSNIQYIKTGLIAAYYSNAGGNVSDSAFVGISDMYLLNGLGTRNTTRLGKVRVVTRSPTTDSAVQFQRPDTSPTNASVAASVPPTVGKSLIGAKEGDKDLYGSTAFNFTNEAIVATSVTTTGFKTDPSGNDIAPILNITGTDYVGDTNIVPISSTLMKTEQAIYEINPKTGKAFTKAELDATTFGVTVVAPIVTEE